MNFFSWYPIFMLLTWKYFIFLRGHLPETKSGKGKKARVWVLNWGCTCMGTMNRLWKICIVLCQKGSDSDVLQVYPQSVLRIEAKTNIIELICNNLYIEPGKRVKCCKSHIKPKTYIPTTICDHFPDNINQFVTF